MSASDVVSPAPGRRDFVLVHGAFHGGWCWARVAPLLRKQGHRVYTPTFTGLGERAHLMSASVGVETFIRDVASVIEAEELHDVVLVGHSFGGLVISGVADVMAERLARLVYLDAQIGESGKSLFELAPADVREARMRASVEVAGTKVIMAPHATSFGLTDPSDVEWVGRRLSPMPFKAYDAPLTFKGPIGGSLPKLFIRCTAPASRSIENSARKAKEEGWDCVDLHTGHDAMVSAPEGVAALLA